MLYLVSFAFFAIDFYRFDPFFMLLAPTGILAVLPPALLELFFKPFYFPWFGFTYLLTNWLLVLSLFFPVDNLELLIFFEDGCLGIDEFLLLLVFGLFWVFLTEGLLLFVWSFLDDGFLAVFLSKSFVLFVCYAFGLILILEF